MLEHQLPTVFVDGKRLTTSTEKARHRLPRLSRYVILASATSWAACHAPSSCAERADPGYRYVIPAGFKGCVEIVPGVDGGPRFPRVEGFAVVEVERDGQRFLDSEPLESRSDHAVDEVWVRTKAGARPTSEDVHGWSEESEGGPFRSVECFGGAGPPSLRR